MTGRPGKCPGNHQSSAFTLRLRDNAPSRLQLRHLVEEEERIAVREDRLDDVLAERGDGRPRRLFTPRVYCQPLPLPDSQTAGALTFPAESHATARTLRTGSAHGMTRTRAALDLATDWS